MNSVVDKNSLSFINARLQPVFWYGYLALLVVISFLTHRFESVGWLFYCAAFYLYAALYCMAVAFGMRCGWSTIKNARWVLICLLISIVWLFVQLVLPVNSWPVNFFMVEGLSVPEWFQLEKKITVNPQKTRWLMFTYIFTLSWFLISLAVVDNRRRIKQLVLVVLGVGVVHASAAIYTMYLDVHLVDQSLIDGHFRVARGWFVNRNHFAGFINLTLVGVVIYFLQFKLRLRTNSLSHMLLNEALSTRVLYWAAMVLMLVALIMSQSRGGLGSLLLAGLLVSIFVLQSNFRIRKMVWLLGVLCLVMILMAFFGQDLLTRLFNESFSLGERVLQWKLTWFAVQKSWLFGYGGGSYGTIFRIFREHADLRPVIFNQSHNDYLQLWLEQGLLGMFLWLVTLGLVFNSAINSLRVTQSQFSAMLLTAVVIVLLAALLQAGVDFNLQIVNIRCYLFVIITLIFAIKATEKSVQNYE